MPPIKGYDECISMLILQSYSPIVDPACHYFVGYGNDQDHCGGVGSCQQHLATDLHEYYGHCQSGRHS